MATFAWLTKTAATDALLARLNGSPFWSVAELQIYIFEGLRHFNGLCEQWNQNFVITPTNGQWLNTGTIAGSPRLRSVTDMDLYGQMCSMLLEPQLSGGAWAGTNQFTLQNLQFSLQKRLQEVIQQTSCNMGQLTPINATPGVRGQYPLADTVLEPRRNRFLALLGTTTGTAESGASTVTVGSALGVSSGCVVSGSGIQPGTFVTSVSGNMVGLSLPTTATVSQVQFFRPFLLTREDVLSFQSFEPEYLQMVGYPQSWSVSSEPPLSFDVDIAPNTPGYFDLLALNAGPTFAPPSATLLGVPDDWSMIGIYGTLADVLGQESESTDRARAAYCLQRYTEMLEAMKQSNWLLQTLINGQVSKTTALADMDTLAVNWQESNENLPAVIEAGMDFLAPIPGSGQSLAVTLVGNAPLLDSTGTYVQVSRDDWNAVLNYAHHVASFKMGGKEFEATMPMLQAFYRYCVDRNRRWASLGIFTHYLRIEGRKQDVAEPRWISNETQ